MFLFLDTFLTVSDVEINHEHATIEQLYAEPCWIFLSQSVSLFSDTFLIVSDVEINHEHATIGQHTQNLIGFSISKRVSFFGHVSDRF